MRFLILIMALIFAVPAFAADKESAYDRVIRTGTIKVGYTVWPPYQIQDPNSGELSGLSFDYMKMIGELLGVKVEYVPMSGLGMQVEDFKQGRYDVVVNDGPYVFTMIKFIDFSDPVFYAPVYAYVRQDEKRFKTLQDLNKPEVTFVGLDGDLSVDLVGRMYPKAKLRTLPASTDPGQMMINVQTGKADVAIVDPGSINTFNQNNDPDLINFAPDTPVAVYPIGFSMAKDDGKLLSMINGTVAALLNTNSIQPLLDKWLPDKNAVYPVGKPYEVKK